MNRNILYSLFCFFGFCMYSVYAKVAVDQPIDMDRYIVRATGKARIAPVVFRRNNPLYEMPGTAMDMYQARDLAGEQSIRNAKENLYRALKKIPMDSSTGFEEFFLRFPKARVGLMYLLDQYLITRQYFDRDNVVTRMQLFLNGYKKGYMSGDVLLDAEKQGLFSIYLEYQLPRNTDSDKKGKRSEFIRFHSDTIPEPYTGLIVDVRGLKIRPALFPRIYDESGVEIYSYAHVSRRRINEYGLVKYCTTIEQVKKATRVGIQPYYLVAIDVVGEKYPSDPVIARRHGIRLLGHPSTREALHDGRVIILMDADNKPR